MKPAIRLLVFVALVLCVTPLLACPNCKDTLAGHDPAASGMAKGYFYSILFMLGMPITILSSLGAYFYLLVRRARHAAAASPGVDPFAAQPALVRSSLPLWSPSLADQPVGSGSGR